MDGSTCTTFVRSKLSMQFVRTTPDCLDMMFPSGLVAKYLSKIEVKILQQQYRPITRSPENHHRQA